MMDNKKFAEFVERNKSLTYIHIEGDEAELRGEGLIVGLALLDALVHTRDALDGNAKMLLDLLITQRLAEHVGKDE